MKIICTHMIGHITAISKKQIAHFQDPSKFAAAAAAAAPAAAAAEAPAAEKKEEKKEESESEDDDMGFGLFD